MKLILIRHGETAWNGERRIQGRTDIPLSERGELQARAIAKRLDGYDVKAVYSSPLQRSYRTGELIAEGCGCDLFVREGLTEIQFGALEGRCFDDFTGDLLTVWRSFGVDAETPMAEGAESVGSVLRRSTAVTEEIFSSCSDEDTIVLTSHSTPVKAIIAYYTGMPMGIFHRMRINNCSYNELLFYPDGDMRLVTLNGVTHLESEGLL